MSRDQARGRALTEEQERRVVEYQRGAMSAAEREEFEREILANDDLATAIYDDGNLSAAFAGVIEDRRAKEDARATRSWWRSRAIVLPLVAAAAFVAIVFTRLGENEDSPPTLRGRGEGIEAIGPAGELESVPSRFLWTRMGGASRYRLRIYDAEARLVHETVTAETTIVVEPGVLEGVDHGTWTVVSLDELGVEGEPSRRVEFRVQSP